MKRIILPAVLSCLILSGCAGMQMGPNTTTGIGVGAVAGAVLNRGNPAAGALIGGAIGGVVGSAADNNNGYYTGPVSGGYSGGYDRCDWRCQDWRREEARREEARRWEYYCRRNWQYDRRCGY